VARRPARSATAAVWLEHMEQWQRQARLFTGRVGKLEERMKHPGGTSSGVRWLPLARWVGWPEYALRQLASIIMRESSGRETADNGQGFIGLLQFAWKWAHGVWLIHGHPRFFNRDDAEQTLDAGLDVWEDQGHSFLPAWAQTAY
jgi:hypothetical protein